MSREQRTRLNVMVSEQTGDATQTAVGRTTRTEQLEDEQEQPAAPVRGARKSVFDSPHVDDLAREPADSEEAAPALDDESATTPRE